MEKHTQQQTYLELKAQGEKLLKQAEELRKQEKISVIKELKETIKTYGVTASELGFSSVAREKKEKVIRPVKYKDEETGNTWTGLGRTPNWILKKEEEGYSREDFLVSDLSHQEQS